MGGVGSLIGLLGLLGCDQLSSTSDSILPVQLSLLVEQQNGSPLSVVVDLRRNSRHQLDVRVSRGQRFFDGVHLWEAFPVRNDDAYTFRFNDLLAHSSRDLPMRMSTPPELLAIDRNEVWVGQADRVFRCALVRWSCAPSLDVGQSPFEHQGPAQGFHVRQVEDQLWLSLPMDPTPEGEPILEGVKRVIGLHWIHERFFEADPVLDRMYRGRADVLAPPLAVTVDAALDEWIDATPVVVDAPWQIEEGPTDWHGAQDASFSLAAARSDGQTCFAGRVRDDHLVTGDEVHLRIDDEDVPVPLTGAVRDWFGVRFELCLPRPTPPGALVFNAVLTDVDPGEETTRLATAPEQLGRPTGSLRFPD